MTKLKKPINMILTGVLCSSLLFSGGLNADAASKKPKGNITSEEEVQGAYYYVDGVEYEIPKEDLKNFAKGDGIVNLPYDPKKATLQNTGNSSVITPDGYACSPGYEFAGVRKSSGFKLGRSGDRVINDTSSNLTEVSQLGSNTTISGKVTGSGSWSWGPIEAQAGFEIGGSYTWTTSQSTSITVKPGEWGWIDYGTHSETWAGDYYYLTSTCGMSGKTYLSVNGPKYKAKLAKTAVYPY